MNDKEYFENLSLQNKNAIKEAINNKINQLPESSKIEVLVEELSNIISEHGTRLDVIEAIIAKEFNLDKKEKEIMQLEALPAEVIVTQTFEKELHWTAIDLPENDNIHPIEYSGDKPICWTGADTSTFIHTPRLQGQRFVLQLGIEAVIESELLSDITVRCNGRLLKSKVKYMSGLNFIVAPFKVKRNELDGARIEVTITKTASPSELGLSEDLRLLGFAISELHIIPRPSAVYRIKNKLINN
jgi:hypothetical protein